MIIFNFLGRFSGGHGPLAPRVRALHVIYYKIWVLESHLLLISYTTDANPFSFHHNVRLFWHSLNTKFFPLLQALPFPSQVVYNRVGKCGSRTIVLLLRMLADRHQFTLISSDIHNKTRLTKREQVIKNSAANDDEMTSSECSFFLRVTLAAI